MEKWDSLKDIFSLRERINKIFEDTQTRTGEGKSAGWIPVVDIYETPAEFVVKAELPEVKNPDINIKVEGNILRISGERTLQREGRNYHQVERPYGVFSRTFILPVTVDHENIKANLEDGILEIILPKKEEEMPRHIEIK
ncbi:MAG: heat-shock protein Hsp20 [Thermodesulfovibrio sp.]|nr:heat-shock protein Hsp20 [Thermodesulfovibrio sp.]